MFQLPNAPLHRPAPIVGDRVLFRLSGTKGVQRGEAGFKRRNGRAGPFQPDEETISFRRAFLAHGLGGGELGLPLLVEGVEAPQHLLERRLHGRIHDSPRPLEASEVGMSADLIQRPARTGSFDTNVRPSLAAARVRRSSYFYWRKRRRRDWTAAGIEPHGGGVLRVVKSDTIFLSYILSHSLGYLSLSHSSEGGRPCMTTLGRPILGWGVCFFWAL